MDDCSISSLSRKNGGRCQDGTFPLSEVVSSLFVILTILSLTGCNLPKKSANLPAAGNSVVSTSLPSAGSLPAGWIEKVSELSWVAYAPSSPDPYITKDGIIADLAVLRSAGFTGLVTYSSSGIMGRELPTLAQEAGFEGLIMGIWDPGSQEEYDAAINAKKNDIVLGYCVGNEGFNRPSRYDFSTLTASIQKLQTATGKPVTTTEEIDDYYDEELLQLGDWIFPNAHPYFHHQLRTDSAVRWTKGVYDDLKKRTDRFVWFKEVGLPTAGDNKLSEESQKQYFVELAKTDVRFVYFEGFDQPWRTPPIEAHWGLFNADRTPKLLGWQLLGKVPPTVEPFDTAYYVYKDADWPGNHFSPSGYMGDIGDIHIDQTYVENPHSGNSAIEVTYDATGAAPYNCDSDSPCKWSGVYWLEPPQNWGWNPALQGKGIDLSEYSRLTLWARADQSCSIVFRVGGLDGPYGDSLKSPKEKVVSLTQQWQKVNIDLAGADLSHIIGGFAWIADWNTVSHETCTFYLDDIRFEK